MNIHKQRRSIKILGRSKLKVLIEQIFNEIRDESYSDSKIAKDYGLSKATFSRFAGCRWKDSKSNSIPDLWMNTAQVLATHPDFRALAKNSGVWEQVKVAVNRKKRGEDPNE